MDDDAGQQPDGRGELVAEFQGRRPHQDLLAAHERGVEAAAIDVLETEVGDRFLLDPEINERLEIPKPTFVSAFPKLIIQANVLAQKYFDLKNPENYRKHVKLGNKNQMKVLDDYIRHSPKDFHY